MIELIFALIFIIFSDLLPWLYLENNNNFDVLETVSLASKLLIIVALFQIFDGIQIVAQGALRGIQDVKIPSMICFLSYIVFGVPVMIYLGLYTDLKATGVWIGFLIGLMSSNFEQMSIIPTLVITPMVFLGGSLYSLDMLPPFWQTITYFNPVVYLINGLRFAFYGVSDFNIWISVSSMVLFLIICITVVSVLLKKGYNIKS